MISIWNKIKCYFGFHKLKWNMSNDHVGGHHCTICDYRFEGFKIPPPPPPPPRPERELAWEEVMRTARDENEKMFGVV